MIPKRAWWALGAPLAALVLWHASWKRAASYLLDGAIAAPSSVVATHAIACAIGAVVASRARVVTPWRAPALLALSAAVSGFTPLVAPLAFDDRRAIVGLLYGAAIALGLLLGALVATLVRTLPRLDFPRAALLDALGLGALFPALAAAVAFFLASERVGAARVSAGLAIGAALVAHLGATTLASGARASRRVARLAAGTAYALAIVALALEPVLPLLEASRYGDAIVYAFGGEHGRVVLTSGRGAFQLYVSGALRLSTIDAHRRREALVHPAMAVASRRASVLVVGGGDGGALREILRYPDVERVTLIEPDDALLHAARHQPIVVRENGGAFADPRVLAVRADPFSWLRDRGERFEVIVVDAPEPDGPGRSKLYTTYFYRLVRAHLAEGGVGTVAGPSVLALRRGWASILLSLEAAGLHPIPYHANLPTMGVMGHALIGDRLGVAPRHVAVPCTWLDDATLEEAFLVAVDEVATRDAVENLLWRQVLLRYRDEAER